ncbi:MAG: hypothetical protein ABUK13_09890 [Gammaproteobacteria bacterium]
MESLLRSLFITFLLFFASCVTAETSFIVSPSFGAASVNNINGYQDTTYARVDGSVYLSPQLGLNLFYADYDDFEGNSGGTPVSLSLSGYGFGVIGKWPLYRQMQPFIRGEFFAWDSEAYSLGGTVGIDSGFSAGLALGVQFPIEFSIKYFTGLKIEVLRYNDISGADIDQFSFGALFKF